MAYNPLYRGKIAKVPARAITTGYVNGTLSGILRAKPVSVDTAGTVSLTDVSDQDSVSRFVGITSELIASAANGQVISGGRAEAFNAEISAFSLGDPVYVGKSGTLINVRPDVGVSGFVSGDWIIFLGVVVKNEFDPSEKDIQMLVEVIGQL